MTVTSDTEPTDGAEDAVTEDAVTEDAVTEDAVTETDAPADDDAPAEEDPAALLGGRGSESFETEADHAHSDILNEPVAANPLDALGGLGDHQLETEVEAETEATDPADAADEPLAAERQEDETPA